MDLKAFNEIENKYNLLSANVEGYYFWIYLRKSISWCYAQSKNQFKNVKGENSVSHSAIWKKWVKKIDNILLKGCIPREQTDVLIMNHPRRVLVDGFYECIYTDELFSKLQSAVVLEEPYQNIHYKPIKTSNIVYTDILDLYSFCYCSIQRYLFSKKYQKNKEKMLYIIQEPIEELNKAYGVNILPQQFENDLMFGLCMYKMERAYYKRVISRLHPKVILEVVSYNRKCMVVNEIADEMGIPTIELQHGTMGEEHTAYNYPENWQVKQFPKYLFLFSEYWKYKSSFPIRAENRIVVGFPYLERMKKKFTNSRENKDHKNILFLSSGPIGYRLVKIAIELQKILDTENYHIIYKLHPGEYETWRERYPELPRTTIKVIDNNKTNLYELFSISDIQVSGFGSTAVFEGLSFSLKTYVLNYCASKELSELCISGNAVFFDTAEDLAKKIIGHENTVNVRSKEFWAENSIQNMLNKLDGIIDREKRPDFG